MAELVIRCFHFMSFVSTNNVNSNNFRKKKTAQSNLRTGHVATPSGRKRTRLLAVQCPVSQSAAMICLLHPLHSATFSLYVTLCNPISLQDWPLPDSSDTPLFGPTRPKQHFDHLSSFCTVHRQTDQTNAELVLYQLATYAIIHSDVMHMVICYHSSWHNHCKS